MSKLKIIQQRVFCIFLRPQRLINGALTQYRYTDTNIMGQAINIEPLGPSDIVEDSSGRHSVVGNIGNTLPATPALRIAARALQYRDYDTDNLKDVGRLKPNVAATSEGKYPINENMLYTEDLWFLHSTWTSFEKAKLVARELIDQFGSQSIMITAYVPHDLELLPNK